MKPALIVAVMATLFVYLAPRCYGKQDAPKAEQSTESHAAFSGDQVHTEAETPAPEKESPPWYETPEWILVIVGAVTAFVIGYQSYYTRKAVDASNRNTSVLMDERRARVEIIAGDAWLIPEGISHVEVSLRNRGQTMVSAVEGTAARLLLTRTPEVKPIYAECTDLGFVGTIPEQSTAFFRRLLLQPESKLTKEQVASIYRRESFIHFYGFVGYKDVYGRLYRVRVHLRWAFGQDPVTQSPDTHWLRVGKPEDNSDEEQKPPHKSWMQRLSEFLDKAPPWGTSN